MGTPATLDQFYYEPHSRDALTLTSSIDYCVIFTTLRPVWPVTVHFARMDGVDQLRLREVSQATNCIERIFETFINYTFHFKWLCSSYVYLFTVCWILLCSSWSSSSESIASSILSIRLITTTSHHPQSVWLASNHFARMDSSASITLDVSSKNAVGSNSLLWSPTQRLRIRSHEASWSL